MKTKQELTKIRKKAKSDGTAFELRVRKDMTEKGWVVDKFGLNVELADTTNIDIPGELDIVKYCGKLIIAKNKWAGPGRPMMLGSGFPDFVCFKKASVPAGEFSDELYNVIGVECKIGNYLSKEEKEKAYWYLKNEIFSKFLVAYKTKEGRKIVIKYKEIILND